MVQPFTEQVRFDDGTRRLSFAPGLPSPCLVEAAKWFSFELCRKQTIFGSVPVDQFWMKVPSLYGQRGRPARNGAVVVEFYWSQCMKEVTVLREEVQQSYILAKLLPYARSNGSRRVFDDAVLTKATRLGENNQVQIAELDKQLAVSRNGMLGMEEFHQKTADLLGPPDFAPDVKRAYQELADELLGEGCRALVRWGTPGLEVPIEKLQRWMGTFARRRGNETKKLALDMLSYECRAAMHRCYSAAWSELLLHLEKKYHLDQASVQFHRLMHFDITLPSNLPNANFHLFHGHIFALHPGLSLLLQTKTGGDLIADYLRVEVGDQPFRRLLNGIWIGLCDYFARSDRYAEARRGLNRLVTFDDIEAVAADQTRGKGSRRLLEPRDDFDRWPE